METSTSKILRILLGPVVVGLATFGFLNTGGLRTEESLKNVVALAVSVGTLLFVSGVLGLVRMRRDRTPGFKPLWLLAAVAGTVPLAALILFGAVVTNVKQVEASRFRMAQTEKTSDGWGAYLYFVMSSHQPVYDQHRDEEARARVKKQLDGALLMDPDREALFKLDVHLNPSMYVHDASWLLDTFTPVLEHVRLADEGYEEARLREAMADATPAALRVFRLQFRGSRHADEVKQALQAQYAKAEARYDQLVARHPGEAKSAPGLRALLGWLREHDVDRRVVPVCFLPTAGLEAGALEQQVKEATGAKQVVPVAPSFTGKANAARQYSVSASMDRAVRTVVGDLFVLRDASVEETRHQPRFLVGQRVYSSGSVYSAREEDSLPMSERTLYTGIAMNFDFTVQLPEGDAALDEDLARGHRFSLDARPAKNFSTRELSAQSVYGTMASSAFDDFRDALVRSFGFEVTAE